ncbi:uncharacterized protein LOC108649194 [Drosophila navojoa]|nr:uncharacterized protein LOC108649194 [Drosophila navojoa]
MRLGGALRQRLRGVAVARLLLSPRGRRECVMRNVAIAELAAQPDSWHNRIAIREPYLILHHWLSIAMDMEPQSKARVACLATVDEAGQPVTRMTSVEQINASGLTFYTALGSRLAGEIHANPHVSLQMYWPHLERSVHIAGTVSPVSALQAQLQFARYPREVQLSMHGIQTRKRSLLGKIKKCLSLILSEQRLPKVPVPPNWGGFLLSPTLYEFCRTCPKTQGRHCMRFRRCLTLPRGMRRETLKADRYDWVFDSSVQDS